MFNKHVTTCTWNTYTLSTTCWPKNGVCWRREPKEEENQEIDIHKNIYITVLFYRCRRRGPPTTLVCITQTSRHHITDDSNGKQSITGLERPWGFLEVEAPRFQDNRHMMVVRLSSPRTGRLYSPENIPGTHFRLRLSRPQGHRAAGRIMSMKKSNPRPSRLERSASTNCATACPSVMTTMFTITALRKSKLTTLHLTADNPPLGKQSTGTAAVNRLWDNRNYGTRAHMNFSSFCI